jgi:hypothetical protein
MFMIVRCQTLVRDYEPAAVLDVTYVTVDQAASVAI